MAHIHNYINRQVPTVLYCEKEYNLLPGEQYGPIIRNVYIIECCVEGYGAVTINDTEFNIAPGDCYILFPGDTIIHKADSLNPRKGYWCAIDGLDLGFIFKEAGITSDNPFTPKELFPELCACIQKMVCEWGKGDAGESLRETACIYEFLGILMKSKKAAVFDDRIERAIGLMETKYHENLSIDQIAREVGLERSYFSILFKEKTTVSPYQYLTALRIYKACNLMEKEGCSITEAAIATGFDPCNFARVFKKIIGKTPSEYYKNK